MSAAKKGFFGSDKGLMSALGSTASGKNQGQHASQSFDRALFSVKSAREMLDTPVRRTWLTEIQKAVLVPAEHYELLFRGAMESFANYVQNLPLANKIEYNMPGGLLDCALSRAALVMALRREHLNSYQVDLESLTRTQARFTYALFVAALCEHLGAVVANLVVTVCDNQGKFQRNWHPFISPIEQQGQFYRVYSQASDYAELRCHLGGLLARQILPELGFNWLAEDARLLHALLAFLHDENSDGGAGGFAKIFDRVSVDANELIHADVLEILALLSEAERELFELDKVKNSELTDAKIETERNEKTVQKTFLDWLDKQVAKGDLEVSATSEAITVVDSEHFLVSAGLVEQFAKEMKLHTKDVFAAIELLSVVPLAEIGQQKASSFFLTKALSKLGASVQQQSALLFSVARIESMPPILYDAVTAEQALETHPQDVNKSEHRPEHR